MDEQLEAKETDRKNAIFSLTQSAGPASVSTKSLLDNRLETSCVVKSSSTARSFTSSLSIKDCSTQNAMLRDPSNLCTEPVHEMSFLQPCNNSTLCRIGEFQKSLTEYAEAFLAAKSSLGPGMVAPLSPEALRTSFKYQLTGVFSNSSSIVSPNINETSTQSTPSPHLPSQSKYHGKLLHHRVQEKTKDSKIKNLSRDLEELIIQSTAPQWLVYSWASKVAAGKLADKKTQQALIELMVLKNYQIPINLCAVLPSTQLETAARHVLNVFENMDTILNNNAPHEPITSATVSSVSFTSPSLPSYKDHTVSFLNVLIEGEVSNTTSKATLFRSNNIVAKILTMYANSHAKEYLISTLRNPMKKILAVEDMEVDPAKISTEQPNALVNNMATLLDATQMMLDAVFAAVDDCPDGLKKLFFLIETHVLKKFHMSEDNPSLASATRAVPFDAVVPRDHIAVQGFLFLRIICPAIVAPGSFGIISDALNSKQRRNLILISKIIQNLANGVKFGGEETYMEQANTTLDHNQALLEKYCDRLRTVNNEALFTTNASEKPIQLTCSEIEGSVFELWNYLNANIDAVIDRIKVLDVTEVVTFTLFSALKSIIARFESLEVILQESPHDSLRKMEIMLGNHVLLGGLEDILLMRRRMFLRALLSPYSAASKVPGRSVINQLSFYANKATADQDTELLVNSTIQVLGPHGDLSLADFVLQILSDECDVRSLESMDENYQGDSKPSDHQIMASILHSNSIASAGADKTSGSSVAYRMVKSYLFAHAVDHLQPTLSLVLDEISLQLTEPFASISIEQSQFVNVSLSSCFQITDAFRRIFMCIVQSAKLIPRPVQKLLSIIYRKLGGNLDAAQKNYNAIQVLTRFLFKDYFCPIVACPMTYNIFPVHATNSVNYQETPKRLLEIHPYKTFALVSALLAHFSDPDAVGESFATLSPDVLHPMKALWDQFIPEFILSIVDCQQDGLNADSIFESGYNAETDMYANDTPLPISVRARSKALLAIRKFLTPKNIKRLKTNMSSVEFKLSCKKGNPTSTINAGAMDDEDGSAKISETVHYKLSDRSRIIASSILYGGFDRLFTPVGASHSFSSREDGKKLKMSKTFSAATSSKSVQESINTGLPSRVHTLNNGARALQVDELLTSNGLASASLSKTSLPHTKHPQEMGESTSSFLHKSVVPLSSRNSEEADLSVKLSRNTISSDVRDSELPPSTLYGASSWRHKTIAGNSQDSHSLSSEFPTPIAMLAPDSLEHISESKYTVNPSSRQSAHNAVDVSNAASLLDNAFSVSHSEMDDGDVDEVSSWMDMLSTKVAPESKPPRHPAGKISNATTSARNIVSGHGSIANSSDIGECSGVYNDQNDADGNVSDNSSEKKSIFTRKSHTLEPSKDQKKGNSGTGELERTASLKKTTTGATNRTNEAEVGSSSQLPQSSERKSDATGTSTLAAGFKKLWRKKMDDA